MMKINSLILGIGETGVRAVNRIKSDLPDFHTATLSDENSAKISLAESVLTSKYEFADSQKFFPTLNTAVFVLVDVANIFDVSLACEIGAVTDRRGAFAVAVAFVPSSLSSCFDDSVHALGELHDNFSGVIRFNEGYVSDFFDETEIFFKTLSRSMSASASVRLDGFAALKQVLTSDNDIYFAAYCGSERMDSHVFNSKCLCMRLCAQMCLDTANLITYFFACGGDLNKRIIDMFRSPVEKISLGYLSDRKTYISDRDDDLSGGDFVFAVICAE